MRRYISPFNGNRYVLNMSTGEIHDLDCEMPNCQIDEIKPGHIANVIDFENAWLRAVLLECPNPNGCHYCNPSKDNG